VRSMFVLAIGLSVASANAQWLRFQFESDPGDWVGQGQNLDILYTPQNSFMLSATLVKWGASGPDYLYFGAMQNPVSTYYLSASFGTDELGTPLAVGTYLNAERAPFASPGSPGLDILFEHRGSNTLTGMFRIDEISYTATGSDEWTLNRFRATFEQHSEGAVPGMRGTIAYSSVPEPGTLGALGLGALWLRKRRAQK
jgi:hypothetical protein